MLSNKQMRQLIQKVYGASNQYGKEITKLYKRASRQIKAEISAFIQSKANWSGIPPKDVLDEVREQLESLQQDNPVAPLASVYLAPLLDSPVNGDLISAQIALPMIKLAKEQQQRVQKLNDDIPRHLQRANHERNQQVPSRHQIPFDYDNWVHDYVTQNGSQADQVSNTINRNIQQTIDRLTSVIKEAAMSNDASIDYTKKVDRILTGNHIHKGAAGHANTILRTQACHVLNGSTIEDFKARGIKRYRFMSLETVKSCNRCTSINDKVFEVANAQEGVNLPPMHPNCQCWIVEYEEDEPMISGSFLRPVDAGSIRKGLDYDQRNKAEFAHAKNYYRELKNLKRSDVIQKMADNSGLDKKLVNQAITHVLDSKYPLYDNETQQLKVQNFFPDYDMAQSMQRLYLGEPLPHDIIMLKHEALEADYMDGPKKLDYNTAHVLTNQTFDYSKALEKWKSGGK